MRKMFTWFGAVVLALVASFAVATPAQATVINGCDDGGGPPGGINASAVCLYNWVDWNKGGGFWRRSFAEMGAYNRNCASLQNHYWHNGGIIYDAPPSSHVALQNGGANKVIRLYDWINCDEGGGYVNMYVPVGGLSMDNNLSTTEPSHNGPYNYNTNWYNRVSSIQLCVFADNFIQCE